MEHKAVQLLEAKTEADGSISGYASVFDAVDMGGDVVVRGAFKNSLKTRSSVPMLWMHDQKQPIGKWHRLAEDSRGLEVSGKFSLKTAKGSEVHELVRDGVLEGLSIGYKTKNFELDRKASVRRLLEVDLWEISVVPFPMLPDARITAVKAADMSEREIEQKLTQDAQFSRSVARALMRGGLPAVRAMQDAGEDSSAVLLAKSLRDVFAELRGEHAKS